MQKELAEHGLVQITKLVLTLSSLWESAALFVLLHSTLKYSPAIAVVEAFCYSLYQGTVVFLRHKPKVQAEAKRKHLQPVSVYTDLHVGNVIECLTVFVLQVMLYMFLLLTVYHQEKLIEEEITEQQFFMYVCGSIVGIVLRLREPSFLAAEWEPFWRPYFCEEGFQRRHHFARARCFMSWLANEAFARTIFFLLPVILMYSPDLLEFVKDATCIVFIAHLDDVQSTDEEQWIPKEGFEVQEKLAELKKLMAEFADMKERDDQKKLIGQQQERIQELQQRVTQQQENMQELKQAAEKGQAQTMELAARVERRLRQLEDNSQVEELKRFVQQKMNEVETTKMELKQFVEDKLPDQARLRDLVEQKEKELEQLKKKLMTIQGSDSL